MSQSERSLNLIARTEDDADEEVAAALRAAKARTGMIPNMYARMANVPGLLETYLFGYDRFRTGSSFSKAEQEVVLLTISRTNGCVYCVAAHSALADLAHVPAEVTDAVRDGEPVAEERFGAITRFTATMVETRGLPSADALDDFFAAGFSEPDVLQIVLAIAVKTISNYSNHLFHTPVDDLFAYRSWDE